MPLRVVLSGMRTCYFSRLVCYMFEMYQCVLAALDWLGKGPTWTMLVRVWYSKMQCSIDKKGRFSSKGRLRSLRAKWLDAQLDMGTINYTHMRWVKRFKLQCWINSIISRRAGSIRRRSRFLKWCHEHAHIWQRNTQYQCPWVPYGRVNEQRKGRKCRPLDVTRNVCVQCVNFKILVRFRRGLHIPCFTTQSDRAENSPVSEHEMHYPQHPVHHAHPIMMRM